MTLMGILISISQGQDLIIHKTDDSTIVVPIAEINRISFSTGDVFSFINNWDISYYSMTTSIFAVGDYPSLGIDDGDTIAVGSLTWDVLQMLGVDWSILIDQDYTYTITGFFPINNDTLGIPPTVIPITDSGDMTYSFDTNQIFFDGALLEFGGDLTVNENPPEFAFNYSVVHEQEIVLPVDVTGDSVPDIYIDMMVSDSSFIIQRYSLHDN